MWARSYSRATSSARGKELVKRRVEQPDRDRQTLHRLEQPLEVGLLERQQLGQRGAPVLLGLRHHHRAHLRLAVGGHEHVLGAAEADALGPELRAPSAASSGVSAFVRTPSRRSSSAHHRTVSKFSSRSGSTSGTSSSGDRSGGAVDGDQVALAEDSAVDPDLARREVDLEVRRAAHARPPHPAGHECGVAGLAALAREDPARGVEAGHVVGLGERAHQHDVAAVVCSGHGIPGGEHDLALGGAG